MALKIQTVTIDPRTTRVTCTWSKIGTTSDVIASVYCYPRMLELDAVRITPNTNTQQIYFNVPTALLQTGTKIYLVVKAGEIVARGSITYLPPSTTNKIYLAPYGGGDNGLNACADWKAVGGDPYWVEYSCLPLDVHGSGCKLYTNSALTITAPANKYWSDGVYYYATDANGILGAAGVCPA